MNARARPSAPSSAFNRLIAIAVSNRQFCHLLLTEPAKALAMGYCGAPLELSPEEERIVLDIRASSLQDFAQQLLVCSLETPYHAVSPASQALPTG